MNRTPPPATSPRKDRTLNLTSNSPDKNKDAKIAETIVSGIAPNSLTVTHFSKGALGEVDLTEVFNAMQTSAKNVKSGDLSAVEGMLSSQIEALNSIFSELARRAAMNMGEYLDAMDRYMRLALRAQSQCRATAETLAIIKQGPPIFANQANVAHGPQQVNNGPLNARRAGEKSTSWQPELLESSDVERLDTGAAGAAGRSDPALEAVGTEHRPEDAGRQGPIAAKRQQARCAIDRP